MLLVRPQVQDTIVIKRKKPWETVCFAETDGWIGVGNKEDGIPPYSMLLVDQTRLAELHSSGKASKFIPALQKYGTKGFSAVDSSKLGMGRCHVPPQQQTHITACAHTHREWSHPMHDSTRDPRTQLTGTHGDFSATDAISSSGSFVAVCVAQGDCLLWSRRMGSAITIPSPVSIAPGTSALSSREAFDSTTPQSAPGTSSSIPTASPARWGNKLRKFSSMFMNKLEEVVKPGDEVEGQSHKRVFPSDDGQFVVVLTNDNKLWIWRNKGDEFPSPPAAEGNPFERPYTPNTPFTPTLQVATPSALGDAVWTPASGGTLLPTPLSWLQPKSSSGSMWTSIPSHRMEFSSVGSLSDKSVDVAFVTDPVHGYSCVISHAYVNMSGSNVVSGSPGIIRVCAMRVFLSQDELFAKSYAVSHPLPNDYMFHFPPTEENPIPSPTVAKLDPSGVVLAVAVNSSFLRKSLLLWVSLEQSVATHVAVGEHMASENSIMSESHEAPCGVWDLAWRADGLMLAIVAGRGYMALCPRLSDPLWVTTAQASQTGTRTIAEHPRHFMPVAPLWQNARRRQSYPKKYSISFHPSDWSTLVVCDGYLVTSVTIPLVEISVLMKTLTVGKTIVDGLTPYEGSVESPLGPLVAWRLAMSLPTLSISPQLQDAFRLAIGRFAFPRISAYDPHGLSEQSSAAALVGVVARALSSVAWNSVSGSHLPFVLRLCVLAFASMMRGHQIYFAFHILRLARECFSSHMGFLTEVNSTNGSRSANICTKSVKEDTSMLQFGGGPLFQKQWGDLCEQLSVRLDTSLERSGEKKKVGTASFDTALLEVSLEHLGEERFVHPLKMATGSGRRGDESARPNAVMRGHHLYFEQQYAQARAQYNRAGADGLLPLLSCYLIEYDLPGAMELVESQIDLSSKPPRVTGDHRVVLALADFMDRCFSYPKHAVRVVPPYMWDTAAFASMLGTSAPSSPVPSPSGDRRKYKGGPTEMNESPRASSHGGSCHRRMVRLNKASLATATCALSWWSVSRVLELYVTAGRAKDGLLLAIRVREWAMAHELARLYLSPRSASCHLLVRLDDLKDLLKDFLDSGGDGHEKGVTVPSKSSGVVSVSDNKDVDGLMQLTDAVWTEEIDVLRLCAFQSVAEGATNVLKGMPPLLPSSFPLPAPADISFTDKVTEDRSNGDSVSQVDAIASGASFGSTLSSFAGFYGGVGSGGAMRLKTAEAAAENRNRKQLVMYFERMSSLVMNPNTRGALHRMPSRFGEANGKDIKTLATFRVMSRLLWFCHVRDSLSFWMRSKHPQRSAMVATWASKLLRFPDILAPAGVQEIVLSLLARVEDSVLVRALLKAYLPLHTVSGSCKSRYFRLVEGIREKEGAKGIPETAGEDDELLKSHDDDLRKVVEERRHLTDSLASLHPTRQRDTLYSMFVQLENDGDYQKFARGLARPLLASSKLRQPIPIHRLVEAGCASTKIGEGSKQAGVEVSEQSLSVSFEESADAWTEGEVSMDILPPNVALAIGVGVDSDNNWAVDASGLLISQPTSPSALQSVADKSGTPHESDQDAYAGSLGRVDRLNVPPRRIRRAGDGGTDLKLGEDEEELDVLARSPRASVGDISTLQQKAIEQSRLSSHPQTPKSPTSPFSTSVASSSGGPTPTDPAKPAWTRRSSDKLLPSPTHTRSPKFPGREQWRETDSASEGNMKPSDGVVTTSKAISAAEVIEMLKKERKLILSAVRLRDRQLEQHRGLRVDTILDSDMTQEVVRSLTLDSSLDKGYLSSVEDLPQTLAVLRNRRQTLRESYIARRESLRTKNRRRTGAQRVNKLKVQRAQTLHPREVRQSETNVPVLSVPFESSVAKKRMSLSRDSSPSDKRGPSVDRETDLTSSTVEARQLRDQRLKRKEIEKERLRKWKSQSQSVPNSAHGTSAGLSLSSSHDGQTQGTIVGTPLDAAANGTASHRPIQLLSLQPGQTRASVNDATVNNRRTIQSIHVPDPPFDGRGPSMNLLQHSTQAVQGPTPPKPSLLKTNSRPRPLSRDVKLLRQSAPSQPQLLALRQSAPSQPLPDPPAGSSDNTQTVSHKGHAASSVALLRIPNQTQSPTQVSEARAFPAGEESSVNRGSNIDEPRWIDTAVPQDRGRILRLKHKPGARERRPQKSWSVCEAAVQWEEADVKGVPDEEYAKHKHEGESEQSIEKESMVGVTQTPHSQEQQTESSKPLKIPSHEVHVQVEEPVMLERDTQVSRSFSSLGVSDAAVQHEMAEDEEATGAQLQQGLASAATQSASTTSASRPGREAVAVDIIQQPVGNDTVGFEGLRNPTLPPDVFLNMQFQHSNSLPTARRSFLNVRELSEQDTASMPTVEFHVQSANENHFHAVNCDQNLDGMQDINLNDWSVPTVEVGQQVEGRSILESPESLRALLPGSGKFLPGSGKLQVNPNLRGSSSTASPRTPLSTRSKRISDMRTKILMINAKLDQVERNALDIERDFAVSRPLLRQISQELSENEAYASDGWSGRSPEAKERCSQLTEDSLLLSPESDPRQGTTSQKRPWRAKP